MYNNKKERAYLHLKKTSLISQAVNKIGCYITQKVDIKPTHITTLTGINYSNGIQFIKGVNIPRCATKAQYREYLPILIQNGYSVKEAADACKISVSYAYKLLQAK